MVGSVPYIAPEVTLGRPYNEKCDVFSFAILLYEIVSLKPPYNLATKKDYIRKVVQGEKRPSIKPLWPMVIKEALKSSWSASPEERPSMKVICNLLQAELESYDTEQNVLSRMEHIANASWHSSKENLDIDCFDIA
jgi:serine/threonine protein kinase